MTLIFNIIEDYGVLPYFLRYYQAKGVTRFLCGVYNGWSNPNVDDISKKLKAFPHELVGAYSGEFNGERDAESQDLMRRKALHPGDWYIIADLDEFHYHPQFPTFGEMQSAAEKEGADYVASNLVDRLPGTGHLVEIDSTQSLDDQFPFASCFTKAILGSCTQKVVLARDSVAINPGHHYATGKRASFDCQTHHFKWHGKDLIDRTLRRGVSLLRQRAVYSKDSLNLVAFYRKCRGKFDFSDPSFQVRLAERIGI